MEERIRIHCVCGKVGLVERKHIGKTITCPKCGVARIKIEDPDDSPTDEDEVQPVDTRYVPQRNQKAEIPQLPVLDQEATSSKARHWQLTAICCFLAIISGIVSYNQYDGWRREKDAKESAERKEEWEFQVNLMHERNDVDREFNERTDDVAVVDVSANDFFAFLEEQPDDQDFTVNFMLYQRSPRSLEDCFLPSEVDYMRDHSDLFLRWAMTKGGLGENQLTNVDFIRSGMKTIRFSRDQKCQHAFRFEIDLSELFPIHDWCSSDKTLETFGSCRKRKYLSYRIDNWKRDHLAEN
jgi:hypothetical protein